MTRFFVALSVLVATPLVTFASSNSRPPDRSRLPAELQNAPLDRVSSGGLMRLDNDGDLVSAPRPYVSQPEQAPATTSEAALGVALDPRVGANIRLGDDPPQLPSNQRAQAEPFIMRSRNRLDLVVATFQEGRYVNGGAIDCGYSTSNDGGLTWSRALLPGVTQAVGGPYFRSTDPVVGLDLNNNVFINMDAATDSAFNHGDVIVSRSTDSGATFQPPVVVAHPENTNYFYDKNWMVVNTFANTANAHRILSTWTVFTNFSSSISFSPLAASYSDDGGQTWSVAQFITPQNTYLQGSQPLFLANGKVAVVYWNFTRGDLIPNATERMEVITSNDGGATFDQTPHIIGHVNEWDEPVIRSGSFLPSATTDRTTSSIYVVAQANLGTQAAPIPKIVFSKSTDGGNTWTPFIPISDNPAGSGVFNPAIVASPDGQTLTAAFYDHRASGSNTLVDLYEAQSFDGGATWQPNIRLTSVSTDVTLAPNTGTAQNPAYMLGDYLGVAEPTNRNVPAVPVYVDTRTGNPDPFVVRIGVAPQFDFTSWQAARLSYAQIQAPQYGLRQLNISTRDFVGSADAVMIGGFIVTGPAGSTKKVMIRGLGPSLAASAVPNVLADPLLELHDGTGATITTNDNWQSASNVGDIPSGFQPSDSRESVIIATLPAQPAGANYTAILKGAHGETGNGLVELYDLDASGPAQLANISTRGQVLNGDNTLIGGFIIGGGTGPNGTGSAKIVVRAIGPSLPGGTTPAPLQDPTLELHDVNGTAILFDDNWKDSQQAEIVATGLAPSDDRESAMVALLPPGNYTAVVKGKNNATGLALVEAYNVP